MQITTSDIEQQAKNLKLTTEEFIRLLKNNAFLTNQEELELTETGVELFKMLKSQ